MWKSQNPDSVQYVEQNDDFYATVGTKVLEILLATNMFEQVLIKPGPFSHDKRSYYVFKIKDINIRNNKNKKSILALPLKLPMVCPPKKHTETTLGGYLLNDDKFSESLIIHKNAYGVSSILDHKNKVYKLVNKLSSTPFKINKSFLDYISNEGSKHNLLIDPEVKHKFADIPKRTKYQQSNYSSYISKVVLQETILGLSEFFSNFSKRYFTVRLDQRGRLYCTPSYLEYQDDLAKALLLYAEPGVLKKGQSSSINYLKAYGANCYRGIISKASIDAKCQWVAKNINDILDYDNGILLNKAKDKLTFLTICMEFKRFYNFELDETPTEFHTYLPIQLDATCNGFQHMALLSDKDTLFKELNLISCSKQSNGKSNNNSKAPNDFYNFLLHKLINLFKSKVANGELIDNRGKGKTKGSYERLNNFVWNRAQIKKAIMTIPYNASVIRMNKHVSDNLVRVDCNTDDTY